MIHIKLLGQPTSTFYYVKEMLIKEARKAEIDLSIEEILEWKKILEEEIPAIPTVRVNNHISKTLFANDDVDSFIKEVSEAIFKEENFGVMRKIIVPSDFSETAANAFAYAQGMAKTLNGVIKVVHAYHPVVVDVDGGVYINHDLELQRRKHLQDFVENANKKWSGSTRDRPLVDQEFVTGPVVEQIVELCKIDSDAFVVVGSTGAGGALKKMFGSVTKGLARRCPNPVLVVPPECGYRCIRKLAYAFDSIEVDRKVIAYLSQFAGAFNADLNLVHVVDDNGPSIDAYELFDLWKQNYPKSRLALEEISGESIADSLQKYAEEQSIDVVAMTHRQRGFFQDLFHKSISGDLIGKATAPVLVMQENL